MTYEIVSPDFAPEMVKMIKECMANLRDQIEYCEHEIDNDNGERSDLKSNPMHLIANEQWVLINHEETSFFNCMETAFGPAYENQWNAAASITDTPKFVPFMRQVDAIRIRDIKAQDERFKAMRLVDACYKVLPNLYATLQSFEDGLGANVQ